MPMPDMFITRKEIEFDAGHRVPLHESKCRNPHGHRYRIVAYVGGQLQESGSSTGMVIDFGDIKAALTKYVHDVFDHGFIVQNTDLMMREAFKVNDEGNSGLGIKTIMVDFPPTAEEMARAIFRALDSKMPDGAQLVQIEVWETPTSMAAFPGVYS